MLLKKKNFKYNIKYTINKDLWGKMLIKKILIIFLIENKLKKKRVLLILKNKKLKKINNSSLLTGHKHIWQKKISGILHKPQIMNNQLKKLWLNQRQLKWTKKKKKWWNRTIKETYDKNFKLPFSIIWNHLNKQNDRKKRDVKNLKEKNIIYYLRHFYITSHYNKPKYIKQIKEKIKKQINLQKQFSNIYLKQSNFKNKKKLIMINKTQWHLSYLFNKQKKKIHSNINKYYHINFQLITKKLNFTNNYNWWNCSLGKEKWTINHEKLFNNLITVNVTKKTSLKWWIKRKLYNTDQKEKNRNVNLHYWINKPKVKSFIWNNKEFLKKFKKWSTKFIKQNREKKLSLIDTHQWKNQRQYLITRSKAYYLKKKISNKNKKKIKYSSQITKNPYLRLIYIWRTPQKYWKQKSLNLWQSNTLLNREFRLRYLLRTNKLKKLLNNYAKKKNKTIESFFNYLESILLIFVYRLNLFNSIYFIKQIINHGYLSINNKIISNEHYKIKLITDEIQLVFKSKQHKKRWLTHMYFNRRFVNSIILNYPKYIEFNYRLLLGKFIRQPYKEEFYYPASLGF